MQKGPIISAIVPVYDEEKTVGKVIRILVSHPKISEVICINDGSEDKSFSILKRFGKEIIFVSLKKNHGKGFALTKGIEKARGNLVIFIDADLIGLKKIHIDTLLYPVLNGRNRAVLGYLVPSKYDLLSRFPPFTYFTGQRVYYRKDLLKHIEEMKKSRFGVEILLNNKIKARRIPLAGLKHLWKHQKYSKKRALKSYLKMGQEIAKELGRTEFKEQAKILAYLLSLTRR